MFWRLDKSAFFFDYNPIVYQPQMNLFILHHASVTLACVYTSGLMVIMTNNPILNAHHPALKHINDQR